MITLLLQASWGRGPGAANEAAPICGTGARLGDLQISVEQQVPVCGKHNFIPAPTAPLKMCYWGGLLLLY